MVIGIVGGVIGVILVVVWVLTIADMIKRHLGGGKLAAWLIIVLLLPFLGSLLYWALRKPTPEEAERQIAMEAEMRHGTQRAPFDSTRIGS